MSKKAFAKQLNLPSCYDKIPYCDRLTEGWTNTATQLTPYQYSVMWIKANKVFVTTLPQQLQ